MPIYYQEITDGLSIPDCVAIQNEIFDLSEKDAFPASFFSLLIRKEHPLGMLVGCFHKQNNKEKLIGLAAFMVDKSPNTLYCLFMGVNKAHRDGVLGFKLANQVREIAKQKGIHTIYGIYDPLEANLGKLYAHLGVISTKYIANPYTLYNNNVTQVDKVLFEWNISEEQNNILNNKIRNTSFTDATNTITIANNTNCDNTDLLIEIPINFDALVRNHKELADKWRVSTQKLFNEYLNNKGYYITNCLSGKIQQEKKTYYLLQKQ